LGAIGTILALAANQLADRGGGELPAMADIAGQDER